MNILDINNLKFSSDRNIHKKKQLVKFILTDKSNTQGAFKEDIALTIVCVAQVIEHLLFDSSCPQERMSARYLQQGALVKPLLIIIC